MKKAVKVGNQTFLCLHHQTLLIDRDRASAPYPFPIDVTDKVLDFSYDSSTRTIKVFTTDGDAIALVLDSDEDAVVVSFGETFIAASIYKDEILAISGTFSPKLLNFQGELIRAYPEVKKKVRFCFLSGALKALADSSQLWVKKARAAAWERDKFRDFYIKALLDVNRQAEFGLLTTQSTRLVRDRFQTVFRSWAQDTVALLQCPCARDFFAHVDRAGLLRIGDSESDFAIEEDGCTGICWELGVLWARAVDAQWHRVVVAYNGELYDLRPTRLEALESPLVIDDSGKVLAVVDALRERPALAKEDLRVLPPIAQNLTDGVFVREVKRSLDSYIQKSEEVHSLLGKIDLVLAANAEGD
jgi:hypothetical protein